MFRNSHLTKELFSPFVLLNLSRFFRFLATTIFALIFFITLSCSVVIEMTRGYPPLLASNILEILFMTASGVYGGIIYRLQLAAIQRL